MRVDWIFEDGTLLTMDPARPRATVLAVLGGRIVAVGDGDELRRHLDAERVVSLQGRAVVPGFHDAHNHMPSFGMGLADVPLSSPPVESVEDILRAVKARAATQPPGSWVIGSGYDQNKLAEGRHPRAVELDAVAPDHLVWLRHNSGHMCVVGGRVLDAIGIDSVHVPEGGVVERDAAGRPTGLLQEQAQALVRALVYPYPQAELVEAIGRPSEHYLREGLTSVQEAGVGGGLVARSPVELSAWQEARRQGRLGVRATLMVAAEALHELPHAAADGDGFGLDLGIRTGWGDEWLRIGAMKIFSDGSLIGRTLLEAGVAVPGSSDRPVVQGAPLLGIHDMVNQRTASGRPFNPAEALTAEEAIRCYTLHSARAAFREGDLGSLEPGKLADFAVLTADPTAIAPEGIAAIEVLATVVGGSVVHDRMGLG